MDGRPPTARSTGMENLDTKFSRGGIPPGALVAIRSDPAALGQNVLYTLAAGRPTLYVSIGPCDAESRAALMAAGDLDDGELVVEELPAETPVESMRGLLDGLSVPARCTVLVEPTNLLESRADSAEYARILATITKRVQDVEGLCGLLALETDDPVTNRWQTMHHADVVLSVLHDVSSRNVHDHLALEKLHPRQELRASEDRVFRLPRSLEMDIDTKKNISP